MFDRQAEWRAEATASMRRYVALCRQIEQLQAEAAQVLADTVQAYRWPEDVPVPSNRDTYGTQLIDDHRYGEDLTSELAMLNKCSQISAEILVSHVATLAEHLPGCFAQVTGGHVALWQACRVAQACGIMDDEQYRHVDSKVAPCLGRSAREGWHR